MTTWNSNIMDSSIYWILMKTIRGLQEKRISFSLITMNNKIILTYHQSLFNIRKSNSDQYLSQKKQSPFKLQLLTPIGPQQCIN